MLKEIKADPRLADIPVVILTTSQDEEDILRSYQLHANCYITKPVDFKQFLKVVKSIEDFWLTDRETAEEWPAWLGISSFPRSAWERNCWTLPRPQGLCMLCT